ncbi:MBL fold metallo-hydrolase [Fodinicola feengrottensis]
MTLTVTFAGTGDAFGSGGRLQACIHVRRESGGVFLIDCGTTSMVAMRRLGLDPGEVRTVFLSHLHADHFGGLPFLILDGQFTGRLDNLLVSGPVGTEDRLVAAMEVFFPGSSAVRRKFRTRTVELAEQGAGIDLPKDIDGVRVRAWLGDHPSGAPAFVLRLEVDGKVIAYTGDTAWTDGIIEASAGADLLIAECYYRARAVPYHLTYETLLSYAGKLTCKRVILTHLSCDVRDHRADLAYETADDGLVMRV